MNRPPQNGDAAADLRLHHEELPLLPGPTRHQVAELPPALPLLQRLFRQGGQTRLVVIECSGRTPLGTASPTTTVSSRRPDKVGSCGNI